MTEAKITGALPEKKRLQEKFSEMLALPKFQKALEIAARETAKTGLETGFEVDVLPDSSFWIEGVRVGNTSSMENSRPLKEIDGPPDYHLPINEFFHFHFHPPSEGIVAPSPDDLLTFTDLKTQPEFSGVGQVDKTGKIDVLVMSKSRYPLTKYDIAFYEEEVDKIPSQKEVQTLLSTIGLSSFLLEVSPTS